MRAPFSLSQFCPGGISRPGKPALLPGNARELLPAGALRSNVVGTYGSPTNARDLWSQTGFAGPPAGGYSAALALRSNVVGTCGSPTNAPSLKCPLRGDQFHPPDESFSKSVPQSGTPQLFTLPYSLFSSHSLRLAAYRTPANPPYSPGTPENCSPQGRSHLLGTVPVPAACV